MFNELVLLFEEFAEMELSLEDKILELDLDSLILIELRNTVEMKYHVDLKLNQMINMTVGEIVQFIVDESNRNQNEEEIIRTSAREEFPLNDLQKAYWVGRCNEYELGNVSTHVYIEFENRNLKFSKFKEAVIKLIERHEMLRAVILSNGMQKIVPFDEVDMEIPYRDLSDADSQLKNAILENERNRMSHQVFDIDSYPFFAVQVFRLEAELYRIYVSVDMLVADACSLSIFFRDLNYLYNDKDELLKPIEFQFRDYIANDVLKETSDKYVESDEYWNEKCKNIVPAPTLPIKKQPSEIVRPKFLHAERVVNVDNYSSLKERAKEKNITIPSLLLAAYIDVLSLWTTDKKFSINVTNLDRKKYSESVNDLIGQFASFTIFSAEARGDKDFYEFASEIQNELWEDLDHRYIGGTKILQKLRSNSENMGKAMMPVVFTCILQDMSQTDWIGDIVYSVSQTSQIWLDNQTLERNGELVLSWDYLDELFPENMINQMLDMYNELLVRVANGEMPNDMTKELFEKRVGVNSTEDKNKLVLIPDLLSKSFAENKENICLVGEENSLTYGEVNCLINKIAKSILDVSAESEIVGIVMNKSCQQIVSAVGVIKAGCAYLPIDASLPIERIEYMLNAAGASLVITDDANYGNMADNKWGMPVFKYSDFIREGAEEEIDFAKVAPEQCMYIIYTSGSTGQPSGVVVNHAGVGNAIAYTNETFSINKKDAVIAMTPFHHDMSVFDIFGMLTAGGKIVVPGEKVRKNPAALANLMLKEQVTIWNSVPALMEVFSEYILEKPDKIPVYLRLAFLGGDWISPEMCAKLFDLIKGLKIVSVGGPTETTLWNICYAFTSVDKDLRCIPYGKPISNTKYYIMDDDFNELPDWVVGNICSTGVGVARGYCNNEQKTNEKFVKHPVTGEKMCISGDLGRYIGDGNIEICGRKDNQIKINGVRIEIEEIESVINMCGCVKDSAVLLDKNNKKLLVAVVVGEAKKEGELVEHIKRYLPVYMIPKKFVWVDEIPKNTNFKVDRKKLEMYLNVNGEKPDCSVTEKPVAVSDDLNTIGQVVKEILELNTLDYDENISLLGGSSIELIKIINRLEKIYNHRMALEDFFENLTVRKLVAYFNGKNQNDENVKKEVSMSEQETLINSYEPLLDRNQREMFKMSNHGLRRDLNDNDIVNLIKPELTQEIADRFRKRCSYRNYDETVVSFEDFSNLLYWISNLDDKQYPNFMYASGGGLYSVQVYIYVMKDRIEGLNQGFYYYDRNSHLLRVLHADVDIGSDIHWSSNQAIYEESAFSIYLVSDYDAVGPMYGNQGVHFVMVEAGLLSEVLELKASDYNLGLCQIGYMDFDKVKEYLDLKPSHIFIHTLIGGPVDYDGDFEVKQKTREYMKTEYYDGTIKAEQAGKDFIKAVNVQDLKVLLKEGDDEI